MRIVGPIFGSLKSGTKTKLRIWIDCPDCVGKTTWKLVQFKIERRSQCRSKWARFTYKLLFPQ